MITFDHSFILKAFKKIRKLDKQNLEQWLSDFELKERILYQLLNSSKEGLLLIDDLLQVLFINRAAEIALGSPPFTNKQMPLDKMIEDLDLKALIAQAISEKRELYGEYFEILLPRHLRMEITIQKLFPNLRNEIRGFEGSYVVSILPLTIQDEQMKERVQIEKMSSIMSLASGIAHEIGNPLNSIIIHLQLLLKDIELLPKNYRDSLKQSLEVVEHETKRLDGIVRHFLKATRRKPISFHLGNINDLLKNLLSFLEPELKQNKIKTQISFDSKLPDFFLDEEQLKQVFLNLFKNAIQAMAKGGTLTVKTQMQKNVCTVHIIDSGVGIQKDDMRHLFNAYYSTKEGGSGLGLMIAYQIVREHGGRIEIDSTPEKGTGVFVRLPIRKEKLQLPSPKNI